MSIESEEIIACERSVWDALVTGDQAADDAALHPAFIGVYPDGFAAKADHVKQLNAGPTILSYALSEILTKPLGTRHALICYRSDFQRVNRGKTEVMYVSSIWFNTQNRWTNIFSQDTPAKL